MNFKSLECPHCGKSFSPAATFAREIAKGIEAKETYYQKEFAATRDKLEEAQKNELELRKKARELEDRQKSMDLEIERKLSQMKRALEEDVSKRISESYQMKAQEKDYQLDVLRKQIEELKRKAEQGSEQLQGEAFEAHIEEGLRALFPHDTFHPVPQGIRGADLMQKVLTSQGKETGTILWELKFTKAWSEGWIDKLKVGQREISAEIAIVVTQALPKDIKTFAFRDGVWVTHPSCFQGLAHALRNNLIEVHQAKSALVGQGSKTEILYEYLTGIQFRQRIETIVEAFILMQQDLEKEKRAFQKIWATREQQLSRVLLTTSSMYGDLQGIVGKELPQISQLSLDSLDQ